MDIRKLETEYLIGVMIGCGLLNLIYLTLIIYLFRLGTFLGVLSGIMILSKLLTENIKTMTNASREIGIRQYTKTKTKTKTVKTDNVIKMGFDLSGKK